MALENKNQQLQNLVALLKKQSLEQKVGIWKRVAIELEKPTRSHRVVNLSRIDKYAQDNDIIIVPGKLLSGGNLNKKVTVIAYTVSRQAAEQVSKHGSLMTIEEAMKKYPKGNNIKIIG